VFKKKGFKLLVTVPLTFVGTGQAKHHTIALKYIDVRVYLECNT
jgi:hypothetical protein